MMGDKTVVWNVAEYQTSGRDFSAEIDCTCKHGNSVAARATMSNVLYRFRIWGYNDDNFWQNVATRLHIGKCKCGRQYEYIYRPFHLEYRWLGEENNGKA